MLDQPASAGASREVQMPRLERLLLARINGDLEGFLAECSDDVHYEAMGRVNDRPMAPRIDGKAAMRSAFLGLFERWQWVDMRVVSTLMDGEKAVAELAGTKLYRPSNQKFHDSMCIVFEFRDGYIASIREYFDTFSVVRIGGLAM